MASIASNLSRGVGGLTTDLDLFSGIKDTIKDTIKAELEYALAPIENSLMTAINTALAPFMPFIMDASNWIASIITGVGQWIANWLSVEWWQEQKAHYDKWQEGEPRKPDIMDVNSDWETYADYQRLLEEKPAEATEESSSQISGSRINRMLRYENSGVTGGTLTPKTSTTSSRLGEFE